MTRPPTTASAHRFRQSGPLEVAEWTAFDRTGARVIVTTRHGGVSSSPYESLNLALGVGDDPVAVEENRRRAAAAVEATLDDLVVAQQVHGRGVASVGFTDRGAGARSADSAVAGVDGLVTGEPGIALMTLVADCVPLVLFDPVSGVLACAHAGWRGTSLRIVDAVLDAMEKLGADRPSIIAGIGPAVGAGTYQVGGDVADAICASLAGVPSTSTRAVCRADGTGRWLVDLPAANHLHLLGAGVDPDEIHRMDVATGPGGPFFSHRAAGRCGRFGLLARIHA